MPTTLVRNLAKKRAPVVVLDLSERTTRATVLQWQGEACALRDYAFMEAPGLASSLTRAQLAEHFKKILGTLSVKCREAAVLLGMHDTHVRTMELPNSADTSFRTVLKLNTSRYFKQEPGELVVDCVALAFANGPEARSVNKAARVLGVGLCEKLLRLVLAAAKDAGLKVIRVAPSQVGLGNAVRLSRPGSLENDVLALVDFGPKTCAITAVIKGQPAFSRVVELEDALNAGLDEAFATPYPVAAEIRANLIRTRLQKLLFPLGRDVSAAIDFFEAETNCRIKGVLFTGGTERAELIAETLQAQLDVPCHRIDVAGCVKIGVPPAKAERAPRDLSRLSGAIGVAGACYLPQLVQINFLAERLELLAQRRRDPVRRAIYAAAASVVLMGGWVGYTRNALERTTAELTRLEAEGKTLEVTAAAAAKATAEGKKTIATAAAMGQHATNRFLLGPALNAMQEVVCDGIQVVHFSLQQNLQHFPPVKGTDRTPPKKGYVAEKVTLSIQAKNFADQKRSDTFMDQIATQSYFQDKLRPINPVTLKSRVPRQVDPLDPSKVYTLFSIECAYPERILGYE